MKRLFLCLLALWMFGCDNTLGVAKGMISERKMVSILTELQVAESKVKNLKINTDSARHVFSIYEMQILNDHNVTAEEYLRSYEYYLDNHRLMMRVHQAVLDTLMARQTKVEAMENAPISAENRAIQLQDSLLAIKRDSIEAAKKDSVLAYKKDSVLQKNFPAADSVKFKKNAADSSKRNSRKKILRKREQQITPPRN